MEQTNQIMNLRSLSDFVTQKCGHAITVAVPLDGGNDPFFDLGVVFPSSLYGLKGYTSEQLGLPGAYPSNGSSTNHSILTVGILMDIQIRNHRITKSIGQTDIIAHTHAFQWHWLVWERQMPGYSKELLEARVLFESGHGPTPVSIAGFEIHGHLNMPGFRIEPVDGKFDIIPDDSEDAPYTCTYIDHPRRDCAWFIIHRKPFAISLSSAMLASPNWLDHR